MEVDVSSSKMPFFLLLRELLLEFNQIKLVENQLMEKIIKERKERIGIGVSGGPDSMVLLFILVKICKQLELPLYVLTVNHNMRSEEVSSADSKFVLDYCDSLKNDLQIYCRQENLEPGLIRKIEIERKKGCEDAARVLRYQCFDKFILDNSIDMFCLGHNCTDQLETLVQRFLQGSSILSSGGILQERNVFFRPLLNVEKKEILLFAKEKNINYRIDETNNDISYFRNRVRNVLLPVLDEYFPGWQSGVLHGAEKALDFSSFVNKQAELYVWNKQTADRVCMNLDVFNALDIVLRVTLLYEALKLVSFPDRVRYSVLKKIAEKGACFSQGSLQIERKNNLIIVEKKLERTFSHNYCFKVNEPGCFILKGNGTVQTIQCIVTYEKKDSEKCYGPFPLPLVIRNRQSADTIESADCFFISVSKVFSNWKVENSLRDFLVIVENNARILGIIGSHIGLDNWFVKFEKNAAQKNVYITMRTIYE